MTKERLKSYLWLLGGAALLAGGLWSVNSAAQWIVATGRGANPAAALNLPPDIRAAAGPELSWLPDANDTGRVLEPFTRGQIEAAYLHAWHEWNVALASGDDTALATYFAQPALTALRDSVVGLAGSDGEITQRDRTHRLRLHFYSADGSIVAFSDERATVEQAVQDENGQMILLEKMSVHIDVIMFLDDGNWRVRHWVRR